MIALIYYLTKGRKKDNNKKSKQKGILLLGGLDNRAGDLKIDKQVELVKKGIDSSIDTKGFRYVDIEGILNAIEQNPNYSVMLFSAGCKYADKVAEKMKEMKNSLDNLYILEPYHSGGTTTKAVRKAVEMGVPSKNVYVGSGASTGVGIIENPSKTPSCSPSHWCSLTEVAKFV